MMTATVPTRDGRLRVVFEPIVEDGEVVGVGEIIEASRSHGGRGWSKINEGMGAWLIATEDLQAAILEAAEVVE